jgi:hypothetical protein
MRTELRRNGETMLAWSLRDWEFTAPAELVGLRLDRMGRWIEGLEAPQREAARILRWGTMISHGRAIPLADQSDATKMPPNCHTFQPHNAARATRVGVIREFSMSGLEPLGRFPADGGNPPLSPATNDA